jgi:hypothetical protein
MSHRKYLAAAAAFLAATTIAGFGLTNAGAAGNGGLPFITGGGHTQNLNSGAANPLTNFGGFNVHATAPGTDPGEYAAKGEVQGRSSDDTTHKTVAKLHGDVVCIANLGPASENDAGGVPENDVWEIRFKVERASANGETQPTPFYGSVFVQDNGPHNDFSDESFEESLLPDPECGDATQFQLEPHQGQITVHNG